MTVSNRPGTEVWNSFPAGVLGSRKISLILGRGCCVCERGFEKLSFCCLGGLVLVILEVPHNPASRVHSAVQMLSNSERWPELLRRPEHNNEHETMMNEVLQPCRARSWDNLDCFQQALGWASTKGSIFLQERFLLLFLVAL